MFRTILLASALLSGPAFASTAFASSDIRLIPGGAEGNAPLHVDGNEAGGTPIIHRPATPPGGPVRNGPARLSGDAQEPGVTYTGPGQGNHGNGTTPSIIGTDEGRPLLRYPG